MIEVSGLTKKYGTHMAVDHLSFTIETGRICGFLGHNGAGKSTTMNMLTGCLAPTEGEARLDGVSIFEEPEKVKGKIGYLPEIPPVYPDMTPAEYLRFVAGLKGIAKRDRPAQMDRALEATGLQSVKNRLIGNLSKGYRQRVGIAQAILGEPEVIILDEPMVGLDPAQILEIRSLIRALGRDHTVLLSSHILSELQTVCTDVILIAGGRLVVSDTMENLERRYGANTRLELACRCAPEDLRAVLTPLLPDPKALTLEQRDGLTLGEIRPADQSLPETVFAACSRADLTLHRLALVEGTLEELFLQLTEEAGRRDG